MADELKNKLVNEDGSYGVSPLEKDVITLKVIQTGVNSLQEYDDPKVGLKDNLNHMIQMADLACNQDSKPDILLYHEFPLTGYSSGTRSEKLKYTIEVPGPETEALGKVAKECDAYLIFGSYATDKEWPQHILSLNTVIGRDGEIKKVYWKPRNIKRLYPDREITTTTIEAVQQKFREKYGIDEEFPVLKTEFGNIAVSTVQGDPFVFAAFAMKGVEIMLRTATLFSESDVLSMAWINNFYSAMSNITIPLGTPYSENGGKSLIASPQGKIIAQDPSTHEEGIVSAEIPIAEFRKNRTIPNYALEMVQEIFSQYQQEIPINHLDMPFDQLPQTGEEMKELFDEISRYLNKPEMSEPISRN
jgi:predicted amidohydrolase|tara:strand:+ start:338 stop:1417 length:1080 start_codon:yes stop_codon:yes gene_type:complete